MSKRASKSRFISVRRVVPALVAALAVAPAAVAQSTPRAYNVQFTTTAPVADGIVSPGEWDGAAAAAGSWAVIREAEGELDTENNRFRMLWDNTNLYVLYQSDFGSWQTNDPSVERPNINFGGPDVLNFYLDPNGDGEQNTVPDNEIDGYQFAFNMYRHPSDEALISTDAHRQGVGIYTEAHNNSPNGDQARWNKGGSDVQGAAMQDIVVAQKNSATAGIAEVIIPWANFNANAFVPASVEPGDFDSNGLVDGNDFNIWQQNLGIGQTAAQGDADGDFQVTEADLAIWANNHGTNTQVPTGLNHEGSPVNNETWYFQMARQSSISDQGNFLPAWNWTPSQSFTTRPHGEITFVGAPAGGVSAVPEPCSAALAALAFSMGVAIVRRRMA